MLQRCTLLPGAAGRPPHTTWTAGKPACQNMNWLMLLFELRFPSKSLWRCAKAKKKNKTRRSASHTAHLSCCQDTALPPRQQLGKRGRRRSHCMPLWRDVLQRQAQDGRAHKRGTWCSIMFVCLNMIRTSRSWCQCMAVSVVGLPTYSFDTNFDMLKHLARPH